METKVFSVEDRTLEVSESSHIYLFDKIMVATNNPRMYNIYQLPSTLIRKPKTDEELAESYARDVYEGNDNAYDELAYKDFLVGLKARGGEFHLTREEFKKALENSRYIELGEFLYEINDIINDLTPYTYPHTITVDYDGEKYYWETIKCEY